MRPQQATPLRLNAVREKLQWLPQPDGRMLLQVAECLRVDFMRRLSAAVKRQLVLFDKDAAIHSVTLPKKAGEGAPSASPESDDGAAPARKASNKEDEDENEEENEENNEGKLRFAGACLSIRRLCL